MGSNPVPFGPPSTGAAALLALLWKLGGPDEYDARRPLTPTGTNLLGLVKHVASVELGHLAETFGRASGEALPWFADDAEPNTDMWAPADQARADVVALYHRVWEPSDATIATLDLDAVGHLPWWPADRSEVTVHQILVHLIAEIHRHAGLRADNNRLPDVDEAW